MIKHFCDCCKKEMTPEITPKGGCNGARLDTEVKVKGIRLKVEVITSLDGTGNAGDFCKYCILDALQELDDRPRLKP